MSNNNPQYPGLQVQYITLNYKFFMILNVIILNYIFSIYLL